MNNTFYHLKFNNFFKYTLVQVVETYPTLLNHTDDAISSGFKLFLASSLKELIIGMFVCMSKH